MEDSTTSTKDTTTTEYMKSKLSICAIVLSLINLLLWFIVLVYSVVKDGNLEQLVHQYSVKQQPAVASAQKQQLTLVQIQDLIDASVFNQSLIMKEEFQSELDKMRAKVEADVEQLDERTEAIGENYKRFKIFWNEMADKVAMAGNGSLIPAERAGIIQTVLTTSLTEDGETGEYSVLDSPGQTLAGVSAEETIEGSGEDMGSGEVDNDEAEELPLPEKIISLLACRQGEKGSKGEAGVDGQKGDTGIPGVQGPQGIPGTKGAKGDMGQQGLEGKQGLQGLQGVPGTNGIKGERGNVGLPGLDGFKGERGAAGLPGTHGEKGSQGVDGMKGEKGAAGSDGLGGQKGEAGEAGQPGINGLMGPRGFKGEPGESGTVLQKIPGQPGISTNEAFSLDAITLIVNSTTEALFSALAKTGIRGAPGLDGRDGYNGTDGTPGQDGVDGIPGTNGVDGVDGVDGRNGTDGIPGTNGKNGKDMTSGLTMFDMKQLVYNYHDRSDFTYGTSFYKYYSTPKTWSDAMSMCMDNDGHLATFETLEELSEMRRLLQKSLGTNAQSTLWVGGRRVVGNFHWVYSTDTATPENRGPRISLSKDYWHTHEPNNYNNQEFCAELIKAKMNDIACSVTNAFVCEMS